MGRLLRISIYAFIILVLYFLITDVLESFSAKQKTVSTETLNQTNLPDSEVTDSLYTDLTQDSVPITNEDIVGGNIDYKEIDKKVDELKDDKKNTSPANPNLEKNNSSKPTSKPENKSVSGPKPKVISDKIEVNKGNGGSYMVICGSYLLKDNANKMVEKLKKLGYSNAKVSIFDTAAYHSAIAGQYSSQAEAQKTAASLKKQGIDCFVKSK